MRSAGYDLASRRNPQARAIAHLRMPLGRQDRFHQLTGVRSRLLRFFDEPRGRLAYMLLMRLGHVGTVRAVRSRNIEAASIRWWCRNSGPRVRSKRSLGRYG